ncbi:hypothetical protein SpAn4DRAFT_2136 [Sporomusa ovata]|uniref:Uncharacterized protein n=1 Tax=Sporomusa ovata TaxID=2378 RepID=A0A0U1KUR0_9FIRM|nr:hypothetical protein SpAn4DRAFT_2136 [Sporomusa ovata]
MTTPDTGKYHSHSQTCSIMVPPTFEQNIPSQTLTVAAVI